MTLSRIVSSFGICSVVLAAGMGCQDAQPAAPRASAINFVVRPSQSTASEAPRGSFDVRGLDNAEHTRVGIGSSSARTVHVRLPAGAYAVAWDPAVSDSGSATVDVAQAEWPRIVVVTTHGPATVDVHLAARDTGGEPRFELASAGARASL